MRTLSEKDFNEWSENIFAPPPQGTKKEFYINAELFMHLQYKQGIRGTLRIWSYYAGWKKLTKTELTVLEEALAPIGKEFVNFYNEEK
jgi:hypothetical protein